MGDPATLYAGRDLNTKSKPGSGSMVDRDSFMIHSVNVCLALNAGSLHDTSCVGRFYTLITRLKLFVVSTNRCSHCDLREIK